MEATLLGEELLRPRVRHQGVLEEHTGGLIGSMVHYQIRAIGPLLAMNPRSFDQLIRSRGASDLPESDPLLRQAG